MARANRRPLLHRRDAGPLLSANALYREFNQDSKAALERYAGKTLVLEGRRGTLIRSATVAQPFTLPMVSRAEPWFSSSRI